uniref:Reverse transcriptase domain-containing protein n=1 Tax=Tanacetum cinerariifolium TaxID=118510 RepID=A0A699T362_TANCI|nr:reverse transcriptase domain-containing protein [Tanacetum cinerariifolium]
MTGKYCPRGEIKKIETEMWNLKVKGYDVVAYNRRFQQLALMCSRMFPKEDLGLYVPSVITNMKVLAYPSAITLRGLAI